MVQGRRNQNRRHHHQRHQQKELMEEDKKVSVYRGKVVGMVHKVQDLEYFCTLRWKQHNVGFAKIPLITVDGEGEMGSGLAEGDHFQCTVKAYREHGKLSFEYKKGSFSKIEKDDRAFPYRAGVVVVHGERMLLMAQNHDQETYVGLGWILHKILSHKIKTKEEVEFVMSKIDWNGLVQEEFDLLVEKKPFRASFGFWGSWNTVSFPAEAKDESVVAFLEILEKKLGEIKRDSLKSVHDVPTFYRHSRGKNEFCPKTAPKSDQDSFVETALHQLKYETNISRISAEDLIVSFIDDDTLYFVFDSPTAPRYIKLSAEFEGYHWFFFDKLKKLQQDKSVQLPSNIELSLKKLKELRELKEKLREEEEERKRIEEEEEQKRREEQSQPNEDGWTVAQ